MTRPQVGDIIRFGEYGTAQAQHVLEGYTIGTDDGIIEGTMPNNGIVTITPSTSDQALNGFYASGSKVVGAHVAFGSCTVDRTVTISFWYSRTSSSVDTYKFPYVLVTGLNFKPSFVLINQGDRPDTVVCTSPNFPWRLDRYDDDPRIYVEIADEQDADWYNCVYLDGSQAYLRQGGFRLPVYIRTSSEDTTFNWLAIGDTLL